VVEHSCGAAVESLLENRGNRLWLEASGRVDTTVEIVSRLANGNTNGNVRTIKRPDHRISENINA
jgi:hypothetical protein